MAIIRKDPAQSGNNAGSLGQHTILGADSHFEGTLTFKGAVRIEGKFTGEIKTNDVLVVAEGAEVNAQVSVGELVQNGTICGNVRVARKMELSATARMYGDIETPTLQIAPGAIFEGRCRMENLDQKPSTLKSKADDDD